jgi:hypothetical protein
VHGIGVGVQNSPAIGVKGESQTSAGRGVVGIGPTGVSGEGDFTGVHGEGDSTGVHGFSKNDTGVEGISTINDGIVVRRAAKAGAASWVLTL